MESVGSEPDVERAALTRKQRELALIAAGGKIAEPENKDSIRVAVAVEEYFADLRLREGKDGYSWPPIAIIEINTSSLPNLL
jgi:hypothetical protein